MPGMTPEEINEWDAFCRRSQIDADRQQSLVAMIVNGVPEELAHLEDDDERYFYRQVKKEFDETKLDSGIIWWP